MSFLSNRNKPQQTVVPIEAGVLIPIEVKFVSESDRYLKVDFETMLTGITATTNLFKSDSPSSTVNQFIDAIDPYAESFEDLMGAQLAVVFSVKEHKSNTFYNIDFAFPMETALVDLLADFEQSTDTVEEETFADEFEETEAPTIHQSKLASTPQSTTTGKLEKRGPSKLGSKTDKGTPKLGVHAKRQNRPPVNPEVESMLEDEE